MALITTEMLFENNVKKLIQQIEIENKDTIQWDFDNRPDRNPDLLTWMEQNPEIVGQAFVKYLVDYGFTNEDIC